MPLDRISFDLNRVLGMPEEGPSIVGMSEVEGALQEIYGEGVPQDVQAAERSSSVLQALARESSTAFPIDLNFSRRKLLPFFLDLVEPTVRATRSLGGLIGKELGERERYGLSELPVTEDLHYMLSAYTVASYVIAPELGLQHPAVVTSRPNLAIERPGVRKLTPSGQADHQRRGLANLLLDPAVDKKDQRRLVVVRRRGERILSNLVTFSDQLTELRAAEESDRD